MRFSENTSKNMAICESGLQPTKRHPQNPWNDTDTMEELPEVICGHYAEQYEKELKDNSD